jgi:hypothetical protein
MLLETLILAIVCIGLPVLIGHMIGVGDDDDC